MVFHVFMQRTEPPCNQCLLSVLNEGGFTHDPLKVDLAADPKIVFVDFFEAVFFVEMDRFWVFAKDAQINLRGFD